MQFHFHLSAEHSAYTFNPPLPLHCLTQLSHSLRSRTPRTVHVFPFVASLSFFINIFLSFFLVILSLCIHVFFDTLFVLLLYNPPLLNVENRATILHKGAVSALLSLLSHDKEQEECVIVSFDALFQLACTLCNTDFAAEGIPNFISTTPSKIFLTYLQQQADSLTLIRTFVPANNSVPVRTLARKLCRFLPNSGRKW